MESRLIAERMVLPEDMMGKHADGSPEDPERMEEWRRGLHKALYRTLIAGAALAGIYQEPWHAVEEREGLRNRREMNAHILTEKLRAFLPQFTVFQTITTLAQDTAVYGPLDQWLLNDILSDTESRAAMEHSFEHGYGRATTCAGRDGCSLVFGEGSHAEGHLVLWELVKMLWVARKLYGQMQGEEEDDADEEDADDADLGKEMMLAPPRGRAVVVPFQYFSAVTIAGRELAATSPTGRAVNGVAELLEDIWYETGQPTRYEEGLQVAPLHVKFFEHFLRRRLGLRLHLEFFDQDEEMLHHPAGVLALSRTMCLFALDDVQGRSGRGDFCALEAAAVLSGSEIVERADLPFHTSTFF